MIEDVVTGEVKRDATFKNQIVHTWYQQLGFSYSTGQIYHTTAENLRVFAGNCELEPDQREDYVESHTTCQCSGPPYEAKLRLEDGTDIPYVEFNFLIEVSGTARDFNSLALVPYTGVPQNVVNNSALSGHVTRVKIDPPISQGTQEQVSITYRIYFDDIPGQPYQNLGYASAFAATASREYQADMAGLGHLVKLGQDGLACNSQFGYPLRYGTSTVTYQAHGGLLSYTSLGSATQYRLDPYISGSNATQNTYGMLQSFENSTGKWLGLCFNSIESVLSSSVTDYPTRLKLHPNTVDTDDREDVWMDLASDTISFRANYPNAGRKRALLNFGSPFKNVFTNGPLNFKVIYNPQQLATGTWVPTFGGTWSADDHTPLLTRTWIDNAGPVDGTATFKMNFARMFNFQWGLPNNVTYLQMGSSEVGGNGTTSDNTDHQAINGPQKLQSEVDLDWTTFEYENSSFGNFGEQGSDGAYASSSLRLEADGTKTPETYMFWTNTKKFPGLDWNSFWGWSSSLAYNPERAGVEFRRINPRARRRWTLADIGCNQIDWVEHIKGIPGEVDEEQVLVVDRTSGIYRINYDQDTVTQVTAETGFRLCTYSKDADTGIEEIIAYKKTDNGDGTFTGSLHSNLISAFAGTDADFWATVPSGAPQYWIDYNDQIIGIRKHYRYHRLMVMNRYDTTSSSVFRCYWIIGDLATGNWQPDATTGQSNASGSSSQNLRRIFPGENYLKKSTLANRPIDYRLPMQLTAEEYMEKGESQNWCQWHPHGSAAAIPSWLCQYDRDRRRYTYFVKTSPTDPEFGTFNHFSQAGGNAWATTHDLVTLDQGDGTVCYTWGDLGSWGSSGQLEGQESTAYDTGQYIWAPTSPNTISTDSSYKQKWVLNARSRRPSNLGNKLSSYDPGSSTASTCNVTSSGILPNYKGITSNGEIKYAAPSFVYRNQSNVDSVTKAAVRTAPEWSTSSSQVSSWPIDGENDTVIMNPMLWDVFGWNGSQWIKEQWYWNYTTEIWNLDPATAFPGKPIPSDGQPTRLGDEGITEYPYADLELTWTDLRPTNSVNPSFAEHSSQVIYNGFFWDGVTTTRLTNSLGVYNSVPFSWTGVVDPYRKLTVPYQGTSYMGLDRTTFGFSSFKVTDALSGELIPWNADTLEGLSETVPQGTWGGDAHSLVFASDMVGKSVTVEGYKLEASTDLLKTAKYSMRDEIMPVTAGGLKSCLSGDVGTTFLSGDINTTLPAAGWTRITTGGAQESPHAFKHWIDSTQAPFNSYFPNGIPAMSGRFARYMLFLPYQQGHHVTGVVSDVVNSTNYLSPTTSRDSCPTDGYSCGLQHYDEGPYFMGVYYKEHVDSEGREWLVILREGTKSSSSSTAPTETALEIWWPKVNEGYTFEYRWRYCQTHPSNNTNLSVGGVPSKVATNTTDYIGLLLQRGRNQRGQYITGLGPFGLMSYTSWNNRSDSWFAARYLNQGKRWVWDLRNPETNFVSLQLPALP